VYSSDTLTNPELGKREKDQKKNIKRVIKSGRPIEHLDLSVLQMMTIILYRIEWRSGK